MSRGRNGTIKRARVVVDMRVASSSGAIVASAAAPAPAAAASTAATSAVAAGTQSLGPDSCVKVEVAMSCKTEYSESIGGAKQALIILLW